MDLWGSRWGLERLKKSLLFSKVEYEICMSMCQCLVESFEHIAKNHAFELDLSIY